MEEEKNIELGVLYVSGNPALFEPDSAERATMLAYGTRVKELHIVVLTPKQNAKHIERIAPNIFLYPTNANGMMKTMLAAGDIVEKNCVWMGKLRANLVVASDPEIAGYVAMKLAKKYKKRLFVEYKEDFLARTREFGIVGFLRKRRLEKVLGRATRVLIAKEIFKTDVARYLPNGGAQIAVVPTFVNVPAIEQGNTRVDFREHYPNIAFMMVVAGDLVRDQDVDTALDIMHDIVAQFPRAGLLVLGDGPEASNLKLRARRTGLSGNVFFEPMPDGGAASLAPYMRSASLFLSTARKDDEYLGAVQALAASTPVIVTTANTVADILKDTPYAKWVCPVGDVACFKKNMLELITGTAARDEFRINAKYLISEKMKNFSGDHVEAMVGEWKKAFKNA